MRRNTDSEFWDKVAIPRNVLSDCWLWQASILSTGYGQVRWSGKMFKAPRLAWMLMHGSIPTGLLVCHHCDNPPCVNPAHLFLGTPSDNALDCSRKGRLQVQRGAAHALAKLTKETAAAVRRDYRSGGRSQAALAQQYGLSQSAICRVTKGKSYRHG